MRSSRRWALLLGLGLLGCDDTEAVDGGGAGGSDTASEAQFARLAQLGGDTTVFLATHDAFAQAAPRLTSEREDAFFVGNAIFNRGWVTAPASVESMDGLGPMFNATNCSACHFKDGRGRPPVDPGEGFLSMLLRLSVPGTTEHGGPAPDPVYGEQLQGRAIMGVTPEGDASVTYEEVPGVYADGTAFSLRRPTYTITNLGYGPMSPDVMISPRVAPQMIGLGLLEAVPEADIVALADPDDRDGDGISGRPNRVWDTFTHATVLGRFGWKANQPTIRQQVLGAFNGDIGITSVAFPHDECAASSSQQECRDARNGNNVGMFPAGDPQASVELRDDLAADVVSYSATLGVPAQRRWQDPTVQRGRDVFSTLGCDSCHRSELRTGSSDIASLDNQVIHPFTDLLLHDMGPGLADHRPDFEASGTEWRTPPLWGVGLFKVVNRHTFYLHDGRARDLEEAILWHGGEAQKARDAFVALPADARSALLAFLGSL